MVRAAVVAAVRLCVGTRFRPQGRVPGVGLDCVGVVLVAAVAAGSGAVRVPAYALGGDHGALVEEHLRAAGCVEVMAAAAGDVLVIAPAPGRRHLGVVTPGGVVHAHAGLGRVVEQPFDPGWVVVGIWQLAGV